MTTPEVRSPLTRARNYWRQIMSGKLDQLFYLARCLYDERVPLGQIPLTQVELDAAMLRYGKQARAEVAQGQFEALKHIVWMARSKYREVTWETFGLSEREVLDLVRDHARALFQAMVSEPNPALALAILDLPYFQDYDHLIGAGAESKIAAAAVQWAKYAYGQLFNLDAYPPDALALAESLCDFVGDRCEYEQWARALKMQLPTELIYRNLGFTYEDCVERITFWEQFVPE